MERRARETGIVSCRALGRRSRVSELGRPEKRLRGHARKSRGYSIVSRAETLACRPLMPCSRSSERRRRRQRPHARKASVNEGGRRKPWEASVGEVDQGLNGAPAGFKADEQASVPCKSTMSWITQDRRGTSRRSKITHTAGAGLFAVRLSLLPHESTLSQYCRTTAVLRRCRQEKTVAGDGTRRASFGGGSSGHRQTIESVSSLSELESGLSTANRQVSAVGGRQGRGLFSIVLLTRTRSSPLSTPPAPVLVLSGTISLPLTTTSSLQRAPPPPPPIPARPSPRNSPSRAQRPHDQTSTLEQASTSTTHPQHSHTVASRLPCVALATQPRVLA